MRMKEEREEGNLKEKGMKSIIISLDSSIEKPWNGVLFYYNL